MNKKFSIAIATFAVAIGTIIPVSSASAHDEVLGTTPVADSTVEAGYIDVSVTFGEEVMSTPDNSGIEIHLTGPDGQVVSDGCLSVVGSEVHSNVELDQAGDYTVDWRSVSTDGHPTSGTFNFTLTNDSGYVNQGSMCADMGVGSPMPTMVDDKAAASDSGNNSNLMGLVLGIVLIVIGSVAGALRFRHRERKAAANPKILSDYE